MVPGTDPHPGCTRRRGHRLALSIFIILTVLVVSGCSLSVKTGADAKRFTFREGLQAQLAAYETVNRASQESCRVPSDGRCAEAIKSFCGQIEDMNAWVQSNIDDASVSSENAVGEVTRQYEADCLALIEANRLNDPEQFARAISAIGTDHARLNETAEAVLNGS